MRYPNHVVLAVLLFSLVGCAEAILEPQEVIDGESATSSKELVVTQDISIETAHPYQNDTNQSWEIIAPASASRITIFFDRFETETGYDFVDIFDAAGNRIHHLSGYLTNLSYPVDSNSVIIRFTSDFSVTRWGFAISHYTYETPEPDHPTDHRPYCGAIGTRSEGWYWGDTGERIRYDFCAELTEPECGAIGSRSEGWYSNGEPALIAWDNCRGTVRIAIEGEPCGGSIGYSCYGDTYCQGMPTEDGIIGGTGTCRRYGYCGDVDDCSLGEENPWIHVACVGYVTCEENHCAWNCGTAQVGPWSWTTILLRNIESAHPYANNLNETWDVVRPGADQIRVHFQRVDTEEGYDRLVLSGDREENALMLEGHYEDHWTPTFGGDTVHINLQTDYSVTDWGFRADMVNYYEQLPYGACNQDADCDSINECMPVYCFNPYAPCYGECRHDDRCDDGSVAVCEMVPPDCPYGTIMAFQGGCYACVDPDTCLPPNSAGGEGDACHGTRPCGAGLYCKAVVDGEGECRDELWCDQETVDADCANVIHIAVPGTWGCADNRCSWQTTMTGTQITNDTVVEIPDNDRTGISSEINVGGLATFCDYDISVDANILHTYIGDLVVGLTDPSGARSWLHVREGRGTDNLVITDHSVTDELGLEGVNGTWVLSVADHAYWDMGTLESWTLDLRCR